MDVLILSCPHSLARWEGRPFSPGSEEGPLPGARWDRHERIVAVEAPGPPGEPCRTLARAIREYRIFPPRLGEPVIRRPVERGDVVGLRYHLLPGVDLFFASRVVEVFDGEGGGRWRSGFTYRTLRGHPELGEETFSVEKRPDTGEVRVALRAWSVPGARLTRLAFPLARRLQLAAGRAALDYLESLVSPPPPAGSSPPWP